MCDFTGSAGAWRRVQFRRFDPNTSDSKHLHCWGFASESSGIHPMIMLVLSEVAEAYAKKAANRRSGQLEIAKGQHGQDAF